MCFSAGSSPQKIGTIAQNKTSAPEQFPAKSLFCCHPRRFKEGTGCIGRRTRSRSRTDAGLTQRPRPRGGHEQGTRPRAVWQA